MGINNFGREFSKMKGNAVLKKLGISFLGGLGVGLLVNKAFDAGREYGVAEVGEELENSYDRINSADKESL